MECRGEVIDRRKEERKQKLRIKVKENRSEEEHIETFLEMLENGIMEPGTLEQLKKGFKIFSASLRVCKATLDSRIAVGGDRLLNVHFFRPTKYFPEGE